MQKKSRIVVPEDVCEAIHNIYLGVRQRKEEELRTKRNKDVTKEESKSA